MFKKEPDGSTAVDVLLYFWDERDGANFSGWWFGPKVGGDQVWAHHAQANPTPPPSGWKVPWDGPIDNSVTVSLSSAAAAQQQKPQQQQAQQQQAPWQQQQQQKGGKGWDKGDKGKGKGKGKEEQQQQGWGDQSWNSWGNQGGWNEQGNPQLEAQRAKMAEEQKQRAEAEQKRREAAEAQRKEEERKRQADFERRREEVRKKQEEARLKQEEINKQRMAEIAKKKEEDAKKKVEREAAFKVRKIVMKLKKCERDELEEINTEIDKVHDEEKENLGHQADLLAKEIEEWKVAAETRIEQAEQKKIEMEKKKAEEEKKAKEEAERMDKLQEEAQEQMTMAETEIEKVTEAGKPLADEDVDMVAMSVDDMTKHSGKLEAAVKGAKEVLDKVTEILKAKRKEMGTSQAAVQRLRSAFGPMNMKLLDSKKKVESLDQLAKETGRKATKKAVLVKRDKEQKDLFMKHTKKKTSMTKAQVKAFAKAAYSVDTPDDLLNKIMLALGGEKQDGIPFDKFQSLKQKVLIHKWDVKARAERAEEIRKKEKAEERKKELEPKLEEIGEGLTSLEEEFSEADKASNDCWGLAASKEILEAAEKLDETIGKLKEKTTTFADKFKEIADEISADELLKNWQRGKFIKTERRITHLQNRIEKLNSWQQQSKEKAENMKLEELLAKRSEAMTALRTKMGDKGGVATDFFGEVGGSGDSLDSKKLVEYLNGIEGSEWGDTGGLVELLFGLSSGTSEISKDRFCQTMRSYYRVIKATAMTEEKDIKSKILRRLTEPEVVEVLVGPFQEEEVGVKRIKCKAVKDEVEGYATLAGNQGTSYLEPASVVYKCVTEIALTSKFTSDGQTLRKLAVGEEFTAWECEEKDAVGSVRVRGRAPKDGLIGWATVTGNGGTSFLQDKEGPPPASKAAASAAAPADAPEETPDASS